MRRVLVTGITGFAGSHLVDYMLGRGDVDVYGTIRWRSRTELSPQARICSYSSAGSSTPSERAVWVCRSTVLRRSVVTPRGCD